MSAPVKTFVMLSLFAGLSACDTSSQNAEATNAPGTNISVSAKSESGAPVSIKADSETGRLAVKLPGVDATIAMPKIMLKDSNFDLDGVKLFPGATISTVSVVADGASNADAAKVKIVFQAPASPAAVKSWFEQAFKEKAVAVRAAGESLSGQTRNGGNFRMEFASAQDGKTNGTILISEQR